ncbi:hypothetical protein ABZ128_09545 [Streptomyces sp. NPDC006326]|uniref:hypothetical protein n=1 Tax=Streptomyces sp. NPDC006326 TaxID=3156752 RepID=UPI0033BBE58D
MRYGEQIEFFGGYVLHNEEPHYVELGLKAGPFRTSTAFVQCADEDAEVFGPSLSRIRAARQTVGLRMDRQVWEALLTAATEDQTAKCRHTVAELRRERDEAKRSTADLSRRLREALDQRNVWKESFARTDEDVVQPLRRELREAREKNAALVAEVRAARAAIRREPARMVIHTTADEKRDWVSSDLVTADVLAKIGATAPVGSLVDDLKNVIVSQAREIARLKGESE